jgi:hypothetical protein
MWFYRLMTTFRRNMMSSSPGLKFWNVGWHQPTKPHSAKTQYITNIIVNAMRTSNLITVKPLTIVPACIVFTQVSFTFSGPCTSPTQITFPQLLFSPHSLFIFAVPSEMIDRGFTVYRFVLHVCIQLTNWLQWSRLLSYKLLTSYSHSVSQEITCHLWYSNVHYCVHKIPPLLLILAE